MLFTFHAMLPDGTAVLNAPQNLVFLLSPWRTLQKRAMEHPKIEILWNSVVEEAYGNEKGTLGGVKFKNVKTGGAGQEAAGQWGSGRALGGVTGWVAKCG
jgi:hypothetical protein